MFCSHTVWTKSVAQYWTKYCTNAIRVRYASATHTCQSLLRCCSRLVSGDAQIQRNIMQLCMPRIWKPTHLSASPLAIRLRRQAWTDARACKYQHIPRCRHGSLCDFWLRSRFRKQVATVETPLTLQLGKAEGKEQLYCGCWGQGTTGYGLDSVSRTHL